MSDSKTYNYEVHMNAIILVTDVLSEQVFVNNLFLEDATFTPEVVKEMEQFFNKDRLLTVEPPHYFCRVWTCDDISKFKHIDLICSKLFATATIIAEDAAEHIKLMFDSKVMKVVGNVNSIIGKLEKFDVRIENDKLVFFPGQVATQIWEPKWYTEFLEAARTAKISEHTDENAVPTESALVPEVVIEYATDPHVDPFTGTWWSNIKYVGVAEQVAVDTSIPAKYVNPMTGTWFIGLTDTGEASPKPTTEFEEDFGRADIDKHPKHQNSKHPQFQNNKRHK